MESKSRSGSSSRHREGDYKATRDQSRERDQDRNRNREKERDSERRHRNRDRGSGGSDDEKGDHSSHHKKHKPSSSSSKSRHREHEEGRDHHHRHHKSSSRHDKDRDRKSSRSSRSSHHKSGSDSNSVKDKDGVAMDLDEEDMWVEKEVPGVDSTPMQTEPKETASAIEPAYEKPQSESKRDAWMMNDGSLDFGMMGSAKVKKSKEDTANPDQVRFVVSDRELNPHLKEGGIIEGQPVAAKPSYTIGDAGSSWRMTKLRRVMEQAAEQGVASEVIGIQRYGSIEKYNEALEERKELDRRMSRRGDRRGDGRRDDRREGNDRRKGDDDRERDRDGRRRNDRDRERTNDSDYDSDRRRRRDDWSSRLGGGGGYLSDLSSAASSPFQRPMDEQERQERELARRQRDKEREETQQQEKRYTPIQSPFVTHVSSPLPHQTPAENPQVDDAPTLDQLNKLRAKSIRAKMLGTPDAETLEQDYEKAQKAFNEAASRPPPPPQQPQADSANRVVIIQTMGRSSGSASPVPLGPGNSKGSGRNKKDKTHDDTGNRIAYQGEEGDVDIHELVRREKMGLEEGMDRELARRITRDAVFKDDLDYMDDNADKIARTVKKSDIQLKNVAINDYKRTQSALDRCQQCFKDDGRTPPIMPIVSMGTRVYLGLPLTKDFVPGHCMIVPVQHVTSTLDCDDDAWDEIRNFMKCLIQMNAAEDRAVIFSETVINIGWQKHAMIECIPVPWQAGKAAPGFFKEAILNADEEWAQHKKLIETDAKDSSNGGFRRRLTSKLPYFHVWFGSPDKGFGHVIEDSDRFPDYFVKEVVASICEMDSIEWRSKKRDRQVKYSENENKRRLDQFRKLWQAWDWTRAIEGRKSE